MAAIQASSKLTHSARAVFETIRDKTPELADMMPSIESVEVLSREAEGSVVSLYNRWQGTKGDVPRVLRPFASKETTAWFDRAAWDESSLSCKWSIESVVASKMFSCTGGTQIIAEGDESCTFKLAGELVVDPKHIPGCPGFLAKRLKDPFEKFIVNSISPNLTRIADAVQQYLDKQ
jgi:hypothetical protein